MPRTTFVFMDFDGVTHPWGEVEDFRCLPLIESVLREFNEARVVIASDWRMLFSQAKLVARFAEDIRPRVAGVTPHILPKHGSELHGLREREAMLWLAQHDPEPHAQWCALDDAPGNWLTRSRLLLTDFKRGFIEEDAEALRRLLENLRRGVTDEAPPRAGLRWR
ncbi:HAD domain-containing protein [Azoarcus olearius]|uniref:Uncharacterized protein n=1 Tax=Azoarcus sp. (strain BH72) TaxID=418699 RepID=A1K7E1_AZOSB|nr:HAD domain-containing protein [Azoarcus olearius]CAL94746.1 Hypothetical protein azo2129 [Azoarcus olearius]